MSADTAGPIIVWENYGYEGWHPKSYPDLKSALFYPRYNGAFVITRSVDVDVVETKPT